MDWTQRELNVAFETIKSDILKLIEVIENRFKVQVPNELKYDPIMSIGKLQSYLTGLPASGPEAQTGLVAKGFIPPHTKDITPEFTKEIDDAPPTEV